MDFKPLIFISFMLVLIIGSGSAFSMECTESYCIDSGKLISGVPVYQRHDGIYRPASEANYQTGEWPYLVVDGGNYYDITSSGVTFKLPKRTWIKYDFYIDRIKETITLDSLKQFADESVVVNASVIYMPLDFAPSKSELKADKNIIEIGRFTTDKIWVRDSGVTTETMQLDETGKQSKVNKTDYSYYDVDAKYYLDVVNGDIRLYFSDLDWFKNAKYPIIIDPTWIIGNSTGSNTWSNTTLTDIKEHTDYGLQIENNITDYVAYWDFDAGFGTTANDLNLTNGNNGTLTNMNLGIDNCTGNCSGWTTSGKFGNGLKFDGVNDYVGSIGTVPQVATEGTMEMWSKRLGTTATHQMLFSDSLSSFEMCYSGVTTFTFYVNNVALSIGTMGSLNTWYHIVGTFSQTGNFKRLYVNGILQGSAAYSGGANPSVVKTIGGRSGSYPYPFNGTIDEVRIYNRALSVAEIMTEYNQSHRPTGNITSQTLNASLIGNATDKWQYISYSGNVPTNTNVSIYINTSTGFVLLNPSALPDTNYTLTNMTQNIQWRLVLTGNRTVSPRIFNVTMTSYTPPEPPEPVYLDIRIFFFMTALSIVLLFLYYQERGIVYLSIMSGIILMVTGLPLVGGYTLGQQHCDNVISTATTSGSVTTYVYDSLCGMTAVNLYWKLQEAIGALFIIAGFGITLSVYNTDIKKKEDD